MAVGIAASGAAGMFATRAAIAGAGMVGRYGVQSAMDAARGPLAREETYTGNYFGPTMMPEIEDITRLLWTGRVGSGDIQSLLRHQAVRWSPGSNGDGLRQRAWANQIELSRPMHGLEFYHQQWLRGKLTDTEMLGALARNGFTSVQGGNKYRDNTRNVQLYLNQSEWVSAAEALLLYWSGQLGDNALEEIRRLLRAAGYTDTAIQDQLLLIGLPYTPTEAMVLLNRGIIDEDRADRILSWAGLHDEQTRTEVKNLRYEIPGPSDLVRFAVRHVFEPQLVKDFGFNDEISDDFIEWHAKQGLGQPFDIKHKTLGTWENATWAQAHWWAHWVWPSPDMAFRMFQRFRPAEPGDASPRDPSGLVFTKEDLNYLLRGNDYPPHWRPYLAELSMRPLDVRSVRWGRQFEVFDQDEGRRRYQDMGYSQENSILLSEIDTRRFADRDNTWIRSAEQAAKKQALKCTLDAYDVGIIDAQEAETNLDSLGIPATLIAAEIGVRDLCRNTATAKQAIREVRSLYLRGWLTLDDARQRLGQLSIVAGMVEQYTQLWQIQLTPRRQRLSTQHVLKELEGGFITTADAIGFLRNLGWTDPELTILLADAGRAVAQAIAKQAATAEKSRAARAKEIASGVKAVRAEYDKMLAELRRVEPITMLVALATKGLIDRDEFIARLTDHGIPPRSQSYYLEKAYGNKEGQPNGTGATAGQPGQGTGSAPA